MNAVPGINHGIYSWKYFNQENYLSSASNLGATCAHQAVYWIPNIDADSIMSPIFSYERAERGSEASTRSVRVRCACVSQI